MVEKVYLTLNLIFCVVSMVMGVCFLTFPIPGKPELRNYRISIKVLAGAYFTLSSLTAIILIFNLSDNSTECFSFIGLIICSSQALLFAFTLIALLNPPAVRWRYLAPHLTPFVVCILLYFISFAIWGDPFIDSISTFEANLNHPTVIVRSLFFLYYLFQLCCYSWLYIRAERNYRCQIENYFSDTFHLQLKWVRYAFFASLIIGFLAAVGNLYPGRMSDIIITSVFTPFYLTFAILYLRYPVIFNMIEPVLLLSKQQVVQVITESSIKRSWPFYKEQIIREKYFMREKVNIEEMALWLKIGRTTLSNYINNEEEMNFNTWINRLRIEAAKQLMLDHPDLTILAISEKTGFTEQGNFSRQFKIHTGVAPSVWRQQNVFA